MIFQEAHQVLRCFDTLKTYTKTQNTNDINDSVLLTNKCYKINTISQVVRLRFTEGQTLFGAKSSDFQAKNNVFFIGFRFASTNPI